MFCLCSCVKLSDSTLDGISTQVLTVFFGSFIAGSFLNQLTSIIHDPSTLVDILGDAAPQVAVFFMTYLLLMVRLLPCLKFVTYTCRVDWSWEDLYCLILHQDPCP